jgi:eukaryotic-like serine/threonine-protein kinase
MVWPTGKPLNKGLYTIEKVLRQGRLSTTYKAKSIKGHTVVIKVTNSDAIDPTDFKKLRQRFRDEGFRLERCQNRYIVKVEEPFEEEDLACIPMEFIAGNTLEEHVHDHIPPAMAEAEALRYIRQMGEALQVLHGKKLLHRDVSLKNIMLRPKDGVLEAVLIDFGLVRDWDVSRSMTMMSSDITAFTAPELCDPGERRDYFTDLYALGAVLYNLITGNPPPKAATRRPNEALSFPVRTNPKIADAIESALKLDPIDRPPSVEAWLSMLQPDAPIPSPPRPVPQPAPQSRPWMETWQFWLVVLGTLFGGFQGVMAIVSYVYPKEPPTPAVSPPIVQPK